MNIRKLAEGLYVAPQLTPDDVRDAQALGIRSIICNRPDGEEGGQPDFEQVRQWFADAGTVWAAHQPVVAPAIGGQDVACFEAALNEAPAPVLAYCRTGTRSTLLWAYGRVQNGEDVETVLAAAEQAGVDLGNFVQRLREAAAGGLD